MVALKEYQTFKGFYWHTASICNALTHQGVRAPHTNEPFSEALLFGVSGGMNFGYFTFQYDGYDPMLNILTRNTFNLFEPILERLAIPYENHKTTSAMKAKQNLIDIIGCQEVPIIWADTYTLPYYAYNYDPSNWMVLPIIVYAYDEDNAAIADRSSLGFKVASQIIDQARGRVKKDRYRITTLGIPDADKLSSAVSMGIWDCIKLFTENPPRGSAKNFGLSAYDHWIKYLTEATNKKSWHKTFPRGRKLLAGLTTAFHFSLLFGKDQSQSAEREMMAQFLEEAAIILNKPQLATIAPTLRQAGAAWKTLGTLLLPDHEPMLKEARQLLIDKHHLYITAGNVSIEQRCQLQAREDELKAQSETDFPLNDAQVVDLQRSIAKQVALIRDIEQDAILKLRSIMS